MSHDQKDLRAAFGRFLTGVTIVTTLDDRGDPVGFTANSFTSVSLDPPLVLVCPGQHLSSFEIFKKATRFGISILSEGQHEVSTLFASRSEDRFAHCEWHQHETGVPLIAGRAAGFICDNYKTIDAGDHIILVGKVAQFDDAQLPGLGYGPNGYFETSIERKAEAPVQQSTQASVLLDDGQCLYLTSDLDLPTVTVAAGTSPLRALRAALEAQKVTFKINVVYAIYDDAAQKRRIVFRGHSDGTQPGLKAYPITSLSKLHVADPAQRALMARFAEEHRTRNFGLYIGNAQDGDVLGPGER